MYAQHFLPVVQPAKLVRGTHLPRVIQRFLNIDGHRGRRGWPGIARTTDDP